MVGHVALQAEPTEPAVRQVQVNLFAQPSFRADAEAVADDQHPDQQLGIDRRPADGAVERRQLPSQPIKFDKSVYRSQQVRRRHMTFERKLVKKRVLLDAAFPPSSTSPPASTTRVNQRPRPCAIASFSTQSPLSRHFERGALRDDTRA